jgi:hypothetical protein
MVKLVGIMGYSRARPQALEALMGVKNPWGYSHLMISQFLVVLVFLSSGNNYGGGWIPSPWAFTVIAQKLMSPDDFFLLNHQFYSLAV